MASIIKASGQTANHIYHFVFFYQRSPSFVKLIFRCQNIQYRLFGCVQEGVNLFTAWSWRVSKVWKSSFLFLCLRQGSGCCMQALITAGRSSHCSHRLESRHRLQTSAAVYPGPGHQHQESSSAGKLTNSDNIVLSFIYVHNSPNFGPKRQIAYCHSS